MVVEAEGGVGVGDAGVLVGGVVGEETFEVIGLEGFPRAVVR